MCIYTFARIGFCIFPVIIGKSVRRFSSDTWEDTYPAARPECGGEGGKDVTAELPPRGKNVSY